MGRRIVAIFAAAVVALIGVAAVLLYARGADARAVAEQQPKQAYVAKLAVPSGTTLKDAVRSGQLVQTAVAANGGVVGVHFLRMMCDPQRLLLDDYLDHVAHVARVAGPAHVGIGWLGADAGFREVAGSHGNSFRTAPDGAPLEMREAYATLIERLAARGWSDDALRAFLGGNYLRVLRQVLPAGAGAGVEVEAPAV